MRHGNKINHLGRKFGHRSALLKNLSNALILHKRIETTLAKAKELRIFVEPIINRSKDNTTHSRRTSFSHLQNKVAAKELYDVIGPKVANRPGGYTRIIKLGKRLGDNAEMAIIELVDFNEIYTANKSVATSTAEPKKRTRRAGTTKKKAEEADATTEENNVDTQTEETRTEE
jgi:large subunit ribosomal protein L17